MLRSSQSSLKMRPRLPMRRILFLRPFRPPNAPRLFTQNTLNRSRPQLPFLSTPNRRSIARFITTETREWIKDEVKTGLRWTTIVYTTTILVVVLVFGVTQEIRERSYPSPREWSFRTRMSWRNARATEEGDENGIVDWVKAGQSYEGLLKRLEDPNVDGAGILEQEEGGILVEGIGKMGYDVTAKSEPWRRGYYELLMGAARAAEHLDNWVRDVYRNVAFPANAVRGPSNPNPRPVLPGSMSAPKEEDCVKMFDPPETYYMRILSTQGFTEKQRMDAALAYGAWLDYKRKPESAQEMYKWALDIATSTSKQETPIVDKATGIMNTNAGAPSTNVLSATTALAIHHASNSNLQQALPIFLSLLRARRSLKDAPTTMYDSLDVPHEPVSVWQNINDITTRLVVSPPYPSPPDDGTAAPLRNAAERCQEAAVMTYIGEILYASKSSKSSREDGLAWTREAVDIAEEELRKRQVDKEAKETCQECLQVGLKNWMLMVTRMAKDDKESKASNSVAGWLGFGGGQKEAMVGRWESEEQVVKERVRRAKPILSAAANNALVSPD